MIVKHNKHPAFVPGKPNPTWDSIGVTFGWFIHASLLLLYEPTCDSDWVPLVPVEHVLFALSKRTMIPKIFQHSAKSCFCATVVVPLKVEAPALFPLPPAVDYHRTERFKRLPRKAGNVGHEKDRIDFTSREIRSYWTHKMFGRSQKTRRWDFSRFSLPRL